MKYPQPATAIATFTFFFLVFVVFSGSDRVAQAQSFSSPSYASNAALGQCYDTVQRNYSNTLSTYNRWLRTAIQVEDTNEEATIALIGIGTAASTLVIPGPWSVAAIIGGSVSALAVIRYYDSRRSGHYTTYDNRVTALDSAADQAIANCDATHLDGGNPENDTDEPEMEDSGNGVNIVGGSQTVGNRGRVTASPVN